MVPSFYKMVALQKSTLSFSESFKAPAQVFLYIIALAMEDHCSDELVHKSFCEQKVWVIRQTWNACTKQSGETAYSQILLISKLIHD